MSRISLAWMFIICYGAYCSNVLPCHHAAAASFLSRLGPLQDVMAAWPKKTIKHTGVKAVSGERPRGRRPQQPLRVTLLWDGKRLNSARRRAEADNESEAATVLQNTSWAIVSVQDLFIRK